MYDAIDAMGTFFSKWFILLGLAVLTTGDVSNLVTVLQVGAFSVLKELVIVLPNSLSEHMGSLVPGIEKALNVSDDHYIEIGQH